MWTAGSPGAPRVPAALKLRKCTYQPVPSWIVTLLGRILAIGTRRQSNQPRSGGFVVSQGREPLVKWKIARAA